MYFPLTDVHLTFPNNGEVIDILQKNPPFIQVNAKLIQVLIKNNNVKCKKNLTQSNPLQDANNNSNKNRFHYGIDDIQNYLSINELNGEIRVEDKIKKLGKNKLCSLSQTVNKIHLAN